MVVATGLLSNPIILSVSAVLLEATPPHLYSQVFGRDQDLSPMLGSTRQGAQMLRTRPAWALPHGASILTLRVGSRLWDLLVSWDLLGGLRPISRPSTHLRAWHAVGLLQWVGGHYMYSPGSRGGGEGGGQAGCQSPRGQASGHSWQSL